MIRKLINKIWKGEGQEDINTPVNENASFVLMYKDLPIGSLEIKNGVWKFTYTKEFQMQKDISPLIDFPDTNLEYESNQLWPFFSYRIPGLNQPSVQDIMKQDDIDKNNEVALLKKFGKFSIYNPYMLNPTV
ncbi:MAG: HipA N-terminal domain-containing protein [Chitinophagales bacterium]|nr:HipA N-terminal domain-containing protein [Chitinophagaceae bacterium]MBP9882161.1 HipA N-terminal domain-containing protein [Chitinophagales bacterium]